MTPLKSTILAMTTILSACAASSDLGPSDQRCGSMTRLEGRFTGRVYIFDADRMTLSVQLAGFDRAQLMAWCDDRILCDVAADGTVMQDPAPESAALFQGSLQIFHVDSNSRFIEGMSIYRVYPVSGEEHEFLDRIAVSDDATLADVILTYLGPDQRLQILAVYDAVGCKVRVPDGIRLNEGALARE
jgi:hypothetical protein